MPYRWNFIPSTKLSSEVFITFKSPRFSSLLKVTVAVLLLTTVTVLLSCGLYLSAVTSVTLYVPGFRFSISISPFALVVTVLLTPFPVTVKVMPLIFPSSEVFTILAEPSSISFTALIVTRPLLSAFTVTFHSVLSYA